MQGQGHAAGTGWPAPPQQACGRVPLAGSEGCGGSPVLPAPLLFLPQPATSFPQPGTTLPQPGAILISPAAILSQLWGSFCSLVPFTPCQLSQPAARGSGRQVSVSSPTLFLGPRQPSWLPSLGKPVAGSLLQSLWYRGARHGARQQHSLTDGPSGDTGFCLRLGEPLHIHLLSCLAALPSLRALHGRHPAGTQGLGGRGARRCPMSWAGRPAGLSQLPCLRAAEPGLLPPPRCRFRIRQSVALGCSAYYKIPAVSCLFNDG